MQTRGCAGLIFQPVDNPCLVHWNEWHDVMAASLARHVGLKTPFALRDGRPVHISEVATSGLQTDCLCPCCRRPLIAKRGAVRVAHFAHPAEPGVVPCAGETILHQVAKLLLAERVESCLRRGGELRAHWRCGDCGDVHEEDLVTGVGHFALKAVLAGGAMRADLALFNPAHTPLRVVEVVVTHPPEPATRATYQTLGVRLFEVALARFEDLEVLRGEGELAVNCARCSDPSGGNPRCGDCQTVLRERRVFVVTSECWRCEAPMNVTLLQLANGMSGGPEELERRERGLADRAGALIREVYSRTSKRRYPADCCPRCGAFSGGFFQHHHWQRLDVERTTPTATQWVCPTCQPNR